MYPERSGEHPSTVPSGTAADTGKESTEKGAGQKRPGRTDTEKKTKQEKKMPQNSIEKTVPHKCRRAGKS